MRHSDAQIFRREGKHWILAFDGDLVHLPDLRGFHYLAALLRSPGRPIHVTTVVAGFTGERRRRAAATTRSLRGRDATAEHRVPQVEVERARLAVTKALKIAIHRIGASHPSFAAHLAVALRRGYYCAYLPDPRYALPWKV